VGRIWNIIYYEKENGEIPVQDFIAALPRKHKAKALREIETATNNMNDYIRRCRP
jgi:hypothetical protein